MNESPTPQQQRIVWWFLWVAFQIGIVVLFFFLRKPPASTQPAELWQVGFLPVLISGAVRWSVLPMLKDAQKALPLFVVGKPIQGYAKRAHNRLCSLRSLNAQCKNAPYDHP